MKAKKNFWPEKIKTAWKKSVDGIFKCGKLLADAKKALEHGQFEQMVQDELPFGPRTAQRLMAIAGDERLTKAPHASLLPQSWMTLYELTRLTDEQFAAAVADGAINPEMRRTEAEALRGGPSLVRSSEDHKGLPFVRPSVWPQHEDAQPTRATVSVKQTLPRELADALKADLTPVHLQIGANRLIDELARTSSAERQRAAELVVLGDRQADFSAFRGAVRELATALDKAATRRFRLIDGGGPEAS